MVKHINHQKKKKNSGTLKWIIYYVWETHYIVKNTYVVTLLTILVVTIYPYNIICVLFYYINMLIII